MRGKKSQWNDLNSTAHPNIFFILIDNWVYNNNYWIQYIHFKYVRFIHQTLFDYILVNFCDLNKFINNYLIRLTLSCHISSEFWTFIREFTFFTRRHITQILQRTCMKLKLLHVNECYACSTIDYELTSNSQHLNLGR